MEIIKEALGIWSRKSLCLTKNVSSPFLGLLAHEPNTKHVIFKV